MEKEQKKVVEKSKPTIQDLNKHLDYWKSKLLDCLGDHGKIEERIDAKDNIAYLEKEIAALKAERRRRGIDIEQLEVLNDNQSIISTSLGIKKDQFALKTHKVLLREHHQTI